MAERPVYIPAPESDLLVEERFFTIRWHPGFALSQKKRTFKNFTELQPNEAFRHCLKFQASRNRKPVGT